MSNRKPRKSRAAPPGSKFINLSVPEVRGDSVPLTAAQKATQVYLSKLYLTDEQRIQLVALYEAAQTTDQVFEPSSEEEWLVAASWLAAAGLELDAKKELGNRWSNRWSQESGKKGQKVVRTLFQW